MGIGGLHPDFVVLDEIVANFEPQGRGWGKSAALLEVGVGFGTGEPTACPACVDRRHEDCWQHDPPQGVPFLTCPCRVVVAVQERYVVTPGRCRVATSFSTRPGFVIYDRHTHHSVGGWFALEVAARAVAYDMNGPSSADIAAAIAALREATELL